MWVLQQVAARVVEVLSRAESLFAPPGEVPSAGLGDLAGRAADASAAVAAQTAELSGATAGAHRDLLGAAAQRLGGAADADSALADQLAGAVQTHSAGLSAAAGLRADAAEVPERLAPWADVPAADLAALKALRARVAGMGQLLAEHGGADARNRRADQGFGVS